MPKTRRKGWQNGLKGLKNTLKCLNTGDEMAEKTQIMGSTPIEEEPLYGLTYLPRKFKARGISAYILL